MEQAAKAVSSWVLIISKDGDFMSLFQCSTVLTINFFFFLVLKVQSLVFQFVPNLLLPCHWVLQRRVFFTRSCQVFMHSDNIPVSCLFSRLGSHHAKEQHKDGRLRTDDM